MENDLIGQKADQEREQCEDLAHSQNRVCEGICLITQVLTEIDLRQSAVEDHVGITLVECIDEMRIELSRLSDRMDALEGHLAPVLVREQESTDRRSSL